MIQPPLRIGLIGAGGMGKVHLKQYSRIHDAIVVAICDENAEAAHSAADPLGAEAYIDAQAMVQSAPLDAVDICTPPAQHIGPALLAIGKGLHVLCEKPLGRNPACAQTLVDAAAARGVLLMNALCHRFHPPVQFVKHLIDQGELGRVTMFRSRFAGMAPEMAQRWFSRKEIAGGGVMLDTAIHSIDLFRFLVGEVSFAQGLMRHTNHAISEVEDTAVALLATADCRMGVIEASWSLEGGYNVVEVYGTQGVAIVHYWDGMPSRYRSRTHKEWQPIDETGPDRFLSEIRHFVDACLGRARLQVTGQDGLRAVEVVYETYHAAGWH